MKPTLTMMIGIPGSGKSTWIRAMECDDLAVHRDDIRFSLLKDSDDYFAKEDEVFELFVQKIINKMRGGMAIADATHMTKASRKKLLTRLDQAFPNGYHTEMIVMNTSLKDCLYNNSLRSGRALVPSETIRNMYARLTIPSLDEHPSIIQICCVTMRQQRGESNDLGDF